MKLPVICTTLLIEKSPQALPLGAACIATAIKYSKELKNFCDVSLKAFCLEDKDFPENKNEASEYIAEKLSEQAETGGQGIICFSCFVWNVGILEGAAECLRKKGFICIAGGPEITAHPSYYKGFDYTVSGEGEVSVPALIAKIIKEKSDGADAKQNNEHVIISKSPDLSVIHSPYLEGIIDPAEYDGALWELARGCPFKCAYCYESKGEKTVRLFPMERIKAELAVP